MRIAQITNTTNFNGIKNIGCARVLNKQEYITRSAINMELTNDEQGNDLDNYRALLYQRPEFINPINPNHLNIELATKRTKDYGIILMAKLNGTPIPLKKENKPLVNYVQSLVNRIEKTPEHKLVVDPDQHLMDEAQMGLIHGENIDDYMDGTSGELDLLEGTGLIEKFDLYMNTIPTAAKEYEPENEFESDALDEELDEIDEITKKAMDDVVAVLYHPAYVKYKIIFINAILKAYAEYFEPDISLN